MDHSLVRRAILNPSHFPQIYPLFLSPTINLFVTKYTTYRDDHEVSDNTWKGGSSDSNDTRPAGCEFSASGACFSDRKNAAIRAYHEWMPIRQVVADDRLRIWRNFQVGQLLVSFSLQLLFPRVLAVSFGYDVIDASRC